VRNDRKEKKDLEVLFFQIYPICHHGRFILPSSHLGIEVALLRVDLKILPELKNRHHFILIAQKGCFEQSLLLLRLLFLRRRNP
jgi:hypothetical protein